MGVGAHALDTSMHAGMSATCAVEHVTALSRQFSNRLTMGGGGVSCGVKGVAAHVDVNLIGFCDACDACSRAEKPVVAFELQCVCPVAPHALSMADQQ
jgi:hypothetical protein